jgi:hypothetical protein
MTVPIVLTVIVVAAFITWAVRLSGQQSERKKAAIADLAERQEKIASIDIYALVQAEVADLGLKEIAGSDGIPESVLLKTWNQSRDLIDSCPSRHMLRYKVRSGVDPSAAIDTDVTLVCDDVASPIATAEGLVTEGTDLDASARVDSPSQFDTDGRENNL